MKTILIALLGIFALGASTRGQSPRLGSGLYRSADDFRKHRLTLAVDCQTATPTSCACTNSAASPP